MPSVDEQQLELFREEGGLLTGNAERDPVSGNEVPPGSRPEEVRDDIPAMLSENEYIVPADVVRYYGVKFFEDLRGQAKSGLMDMERGGRIGGEPVGAPEDDLTPEEMQMLAEISGMYAGGDVRRPKRDSMSVDEVLAGDFSLYDIINSPVRIRTPYGDDATTPEMKRELFKRMGLIQIADASGMYGGGMVRKGYQEGGFVNRPFTPIPNYTTPGFSLFQPVQSAAPVQIPQTEAVTLYGPNGEIVTLNLPTDQERYNALIGQGYSTQQQVRQPTVQGGDSGGDSGTPAGVPTAPGLGADAQLDFTPLNPEEYNAFLEDPLKFGAEALKGKDYSRLFAGAGAVNPVLGLIGGAVGAGMTAQNVAQARAASQIAKAKGLDTTALDTQIDSYISGLPNLSRVSSDLLASGDQMAERFFQTARDLRLPGSQYGDSPLTRDFFAPGAAGDEAFKKEMETTAPPGMVYDPTVGAGTPSLTYNEETKKFEDRGETLPGGGYVRPESESAAPTSSPKPGKKPARQPDGTPTGAPESSSDSGRDREPITVAGGYTGLKDMFDGGGPGQDKDGNENTGCFLTTAVVEMRGEEDDGYTLSTLRKFRDTYLKNKNNEVDRYYEVAPKLVKAIPLEDKTWVWIGKRVDKAIQYIEEGKNGLAYQTYKRMVEKLERDWLKE
jgi:hypothetical protein